MTSPTPIPGIPSLDFTRFLNQPDEQLGGVGETIGNYLQYFLTPGVAEVRSRSGSRSGFCFALAIEGNRLKSMKPSPLIKITMGIALSGLLAAIVIPNYIKARTTRSMSTCTDVNLRLIADAKTQWATDHHMSSGTVPEVTDLLPYFKDGRMPTCPIGGTYVIGPIGSNPACSLTNVCGAPR